MYCQKKKICDRIQNNRIRRGGVTMNKSELVAIMAEKASLSKKDAEGTFRLCRFALSVALAVFSLHLYAVCQGRRIFLTYFILALDI